MSESSSFVNRGATEQVANLKSYDAYIEKRHSELLRAMAVIFSESKENSDKNDTNFVH